MAEIVGDSHDINDRKILIEETYSDNHTISDGAKLGKINFDNTADNILDNWSEKKYIANPYLLDKIIRTSKVIQALY